MVQGHSGYLVSIKPFRAIFLTEEKKEEGRERQMLLFFCSLGNQWSGICVSICRDT